MLWIILPSEAIGPCVNFDPLRRFPLLLVDLLHSLFVVSIVALKLLGSLDDIEPTQAMDLVLRPVSQLRLWLAGLQMGGERAITSTQSCLRYDIRLAWGSRLVSDGPVKCHVLGYFFARRGSRLCEEWLRLLNVEVAGHVARLADMSQARRPSHYLLWWLSMVSSLFLRLSDQLSLFSLVNGVRVLVRPAFSLLNILLALLCMMPIFGSSVLPFWQMLVLE